MSTTLSWADKLALKERFQLSPQEACKAFGITSAELNTAITLAEKGVFFVNKKLNTEIYSDFFTKMRSGEQVSLPNVNRVKVGAKPSKITKAFDAITTTPQSVDSLIESYDVSLAVLRQSKRFDKNNAGRIHIRKDKATGTLMVWRVLDES